MDPHSKIYDNIYKENTEKPTSFFKDDNQLTDE